MASITLNIGGHEYTDKYSGIDVGYNMNILACNVVVDGSDVLNHFNITCDDNWIEIHRIRNRVDIIVHKNNSLDGRIGTILFEHNLDFNTYISLSINQVASEYPIEISTSTIQFSNLLPRDSETSESVIVNVTTQNGICDFGIGPVVEYAKNDEDGDNPLYVVPYDNGIKLKKLNKEQLEITNYGKVSLYDENYYIVKLYHLNNPRSNVQIKVEYVRNNNETGFDLG
jgi:hypothetical protein